MKYNLQHEKVRNLHPSILFWLRNSIKIKGFRKRELSRIKRFERKVVSSKGAISNPGADRQRHRLQPLQNVTIFPDNALSFRVYCEHRKDNGPKQTVSIKTSSFLFKFIYYNQYIQATGQKGTDISALPISGLQINRGCFRSQTV